MSGPVVYESRLPDPFHLTPLSGTHTLAHSRRRSLQASDLQYQNGCSILGASIGPEVPNLGHISALITWTCPIAISSP